MNTLTEEHLREASCIGDLETIQRLIKQNVNVNSKNAINGWTALHWACKRGHVNIVKCLLLNGANITITNTKNETPIHVCTNPIILNMFGVENTNKNQIINSELEFIPNYIKNAPINQQVQIVETTTNLILPVRIEHDDDFIEIELPPSQLTYNYLLNLCCKELQVQITNVRKIRKLPCTQMRNDQDVMKLNKNDKIELVLINK